MIQVELTQQQWKDVLALMERGVISIGYPAFASGGELIRQVGEQAELIPAKSPAENITAEGHHDQTSR